MRTLPFALALTLFAVDAHAAGLFEPTPLDDETYAESFTLSVDLGGGRFLQTQLAISNLGPGDKQGACRYSLIVGGRERSGAEKFDEDKWGYDKAPKLTVGPCALRTQGDDIVFEAPLKDGKVIATVHAKAVRVRPPDHRVAVGKKFYETEILVPWAKVTVALDVPGVSDKTLEGFGLLDHSRSTTLPGDLATRWVRFRVLDPEQGRLFLVRYPPKGGTPKAWAWSAQRAKPQAVPRVKVGRKPGSEPPVFRTLAMVEGKTWKMLSTKLIHRYAPVEKHGMLGRIVGSVVGNPVTYTYVGTLEAEGRTFTGLMEVTLLK